MTWWAEKPISRKEKCAQVHIIIGCTKKVTAKWYIVTQIGRLFSSAVQSGDHQIARTKTIPPCGWYLENKGSFDLSKGIVR